MWRQCFLFFFMRVHTTHSCNLIHIKGVIDLYKDNIQNLNPLVITYNTKHITVFPYGAIVFWDCTSKEQADFIATIQPFIAEPYKTVLEDIEQVDSGKDFSFGDHVLTVPAINSKTIAIISLVLARSLALERQEETIHTQLATFSDLHTTNKKIIENPISVKKLLRTVGESMDARQNMILSMSMLDTPDIAWNDSVLAEYYRSLLAEFEVDIRFKQTMRKLDLLIQHSEFMLHVIENKRAFWLEVTIVVLILIEIIMFGYDLWVH